MALYLSCWDSFEGTRQLTRRDKNPRLLPHVSSVSIKHAIEAHQRRLAEHAAASHMLVGTGDPAHTHPIVRKLQIHTMYRRVNHKHTTRCKEWTPCKAIWHAPVSAQPAPSFHRSDQVFLDPS